MKILFLIEKDPPMTAVSEWEDIKKYKDKGLLAPSKDYYVLFKALEQNPKLEEEILLARKNAGIPTSGILWDEYYYNYYMESLRAYSPEESKKYNDFFSNVENEAKKIKERVQLNSYVANQLKNLIIGNFVFPEDFPITFGATPIDEGDLTLGNGNVFIHIYHKVTLNKLTTYIEDNWKNIEPLMNSLPPAPKYGISKRDFRIVQLRDKKDMKFSEIADKIIDEFGVDELDAMNEDSAKTAYRRAKAKIDDLIKSPKK